MRDGYKNTSRVWWPSGATGQEPLVVWYHGGGFCLGDAAFEEEVCQRLCRGLNAVLVSVNYRLAPDDPFPTSINDCWDSLQWVRAGSRDEEICTIVLTMAVDCVSFSGIESKQKIRVYHQRQQRRRQYLRNSEPSSSRRRPHPHYGGLPRDAYCCTPKSCAGDTPGFIQKLRRKQRRTMFEPG